MKRAAVLSFVVFLVSCGGVEQPSGDAIVDQPNNSPTVSLVANPTTGDAPLEVRFTPQVEDLDGDDLAYYWDFGNGETARAEVTRAYTYEEEGTYTATLRVSDGKTESSSSVDIVVTGANGSEPSTPPSSEPNRQQTERLRGTWLFVYSIVSTFDDTYSLSSNVEESDTTPGEFNIFGENEFGGLVVAGYSPELQEFSLLDPGAAIDKFFVFDFSDEDDVEGCYFQVDTSTGDFSDCYIMIGGRISTARVTEQSLRYFSENKRLREDEKLKYKGLAPSNLVESRFEDMKKQLRTRDR